MHNDTFEANNNFLNSNYHSVPVAPRRHPPSLTALIKEHNSTYELSDNDKTDGMEAKDSANSQMRSKHDASSRSLPADAKDDSLNGKRLSDEPFFDGEENAEKINGNGQENFVYRTVTGGVVRSVHPPGKGNATVYKVGCV